MSSILRTRLGWTSSGAALAVLAALSTALAATGASASAITMVNMTVTLDIVAAGEPGKIGDIDHLRLVFDADAVDPKTKRVKLLNVQHFTGGRYAPPAPDAHVMPTDDSWLDTGTTPYRLHYRAAVVHGRAIIIEFDENTRRLTIRPQNDPAAILESGRYDIDPTPITGPEAIAAGSAQPAKK
jgi:hypothetical protein